MTFEGKKGTHHNVRRSRVLSSGPRLLEGPRFLALLAFQKTRTGTRFLRISPPQSNKGTEQNGDKLFWRSFMPNVNAKTRSSGTELESDSFAVQMLQTIFPKVFRPDLLALDGVGVVLFHRRAHLMPRLIQRFC